MMMFEGGKFRYHTNVGFRDSPRLFFQIFFETDGPLSIKELRSALSPGAWAITKARLLDEIGAVCVGWIAGVLS
jgi:hypothetical protein